MEKAIFIGVIILGLFFVSIGIENAETSAMPSESPNIGFEFLQ